MSDKPQVVIIRKDKRLHKGLHLFAFVLTGGASAPVTAAKAGTNAAYNARTAKLAAGPRPPRPAAMRVPYEWRVRADAQARTELGLPLTGKLSRDQKRALRARTDELLEDDA